MIARPKPQPPIPPTLASCVYLGWLRRDGGPWQAVTGAESAGECLTRLLDVPGGKVNDRVVLRQGKRP